MQRLRLVSGLGFWFVLALVVSFATGLAARPWGWAGIAMLFAVVPSQIAWTLSGRRAAVVTVLAGTVVTVAVAALTPLPASRLEDVVDDLGLPAATWVEMGDRSGGGPFCVPECPSYTRSYAATGAGDRVVRTLVDALRRKGFFVYAVPVGDGAEFAGRSGRVKTTVVLVRVEDEQYDVSITMTSAPGSGDAPTPFAGVRPQADAPTRSVASAFSRL